MLDGTEIESIREDGACLCDSTDDDILRWIVEHVSELRIGTSLQIKRDPFGWIVTIKCPLEQLSIHNLKNYLKDKGWKEVPFERVTTLKFRSPRPIRENERLDIFIPSKRELIDYTRMIELAIEAISAFEGRTFEEVLSQLCGRID
jgi:hypothetical protein